MRFENNNLRKKQTHGDEDFLTCGFACQYLHFAQTEDIWLKSASEGKSGVSLSTESYLRELPSQFVVSPHTTLKNLFIDRPVVI